MYAAGSRSVTSNSSEEVWKHARVVAERLFNDPHLIRVDRLMANLPPRNVRGRNRTLWRFAEAELR